MERVERYNKIKTYIHWQETSGEELKRVERSNENLNTQGKKQVEVYTLLSNSLRTSRGNLTMAESRERTETRKGGKKRKDESEK